MGGTGWSSTVWLDTALCCVAFPHERADGRSCPSTIEGDLQLLPPNFGDYLLGAGAGQIWLAVWAPDWVGVLPRRQYAHRERRLCDDGVAERGGACWGGSVELCGAHHLAR